MVTRQITLVVLLTLCALWVPATQAAALQPSASEVLLDVAASHPNLIVRINTQEDLINLNIDPVVRVKMVYAIAYGSWIVTTRTPVTSGKWTGRPWLAIGGHARYFYFAYETLPDGTDVGDMGGVVGVADGKAVTEFGQDMTTVGLNLAALGAATGGPAGKAAQGIGLGIAGIGMAVNAVGLGMQVAEDLASPSPKQGHVDPTGMPAAGGPPGSDPNGPTGQSPPGIGVNGNGNSPTGGMSGSGSDAGTGFGDPGED